MAGCSRKRNTAVSEELQEIQQMVEIIKTDEGVSIEYMKSFEREWLLHEEGRNEGRKEGRREGREEEQANTERERKRAMEAEARVEELQKELERIKRNIK